MKRLYAAVLAASLSFGALVTLSGCPDNPYKASTWTKKLKDPKESERAITELEQLGDPGAITALGEAWHDQGYPPRMLQVIIALAHPLTPKEAEAKFFTDFQESGREAHWADALPFLLEAVTKVDETNPRSVESAQKAAEALGEAKDASAMEPLKNLALGASASNSGGVKFTKKLVSAQAAAAKALGQFDTEKVKAAQLLAEILANKAPPDPKTGANTGEKRKLADDLELYLLVMNNAVTALGDLHAPSAAPTLAAQMYKTPSLFANIRRALVACGPAAEEELRKILRNENQPIAQLIKDNKYDVYCGDKNEIPADKCLPMGAKDFYPAVVLGDFYDPKSVPDLLTALKRPVAPQYYQDAETPSDATNYTAILDALRKIGAADAEPAVRSIWEGTAQPEAATPDPKKKPDPKKPAKPAETPAAGAPELDIRTKTFAIGVYPFVARNEAAAADLVKIADGKLTQPAGVDLQQWNAFRQEASTAFARLSVNPGDIDVLMREAQVQFDAAAKKKEVSAKEKPKFDAAEAALKAAQKARDDAKAASLKAAHSNMSAEEIQAAANAVKKAEDAVKEEKAKHKIAVAAYNEAERDAKNLKSFGRLFQMHTGRIVVAMICKKDVECYAKRLSMKPDDAANDCKDYIKDIKDWTPEEKMGLLEAEIERSMLEIGKAGQSATGLTNKLLDAAKSDDRLIRQSVLLALPKIAKVPCPECEAKLDAAVQAGQGKTTITDLVLETTMLRNYFAWAGGNTPHKKAAPADDASKPADKK